jgi:hypothetical protein
MQIMNNMPTNYSTYLYERLYDIKQRVDNGLAVMTLNISDSAETGRVPYEGLNDVFVASTFIAINETISNNSLGDDEVYTLTKLKVVNEIQQKLADWKEDPYYQQNIPNLN